MRFKRLKHGAFFLNYRLDKRGSFWYNEVKAFFAAKKQKCRLEKCSTKTPGCQSYSFVKTKINLQLFGL
jgi:hypothetical protein